MYKPGEKVAWADGNGRAHVGMIVKRSRYAPVWFIDTGSEDCLIEELRLSPASNLAEAAKEVTHDPAEKDIEALRHALSRPDVCGNKESGIKTPIKTGDMVRIINKGEKHYGRVGKVIKIDTSYMSHSAEVSFEDCNAYYNVYELEPVKSNQTVQEANKLLYTQEELDKARTEGFRQGSAECMKRCLEALKNINVHGFEC